MSKFRRRISGQSSNDAPWRAARKIMNTWSGPCLRTRGVSPVRDAQESKGGRILAIAACLCHVSGTASQPFQSPITIIKYDPIDFAALSLATLVLTGCNNRTRDAVRWDQIAEAHKSRLKCSAVDRSEISLGKRGAPQRNRLVKGDLSAKRVVGVKLESLNAGRE